MPRYTRSRRWALALAGVGALVSLAPGTRAAAQQPADSFASAVYVPASCAGPPGRRCPLVVFPQVPWTLARSTSAAQALLAQQRALAEQYGAILLVPASATIPEAADTQLQRVLRTYAVDSAKVALVGYRVVLESCPDPAVFRQVALLSPAIGLSPGCLPEGAGAPPAARTVQVYLDGGLGEVGFIPRTMLKMPKLRQQGYVFTLALALRDYDARPDDFDRMWRRLSESWTASVPGGASADPAETPSATDTDRASADAGSDAGPLLTTRALGQLTTFWTRFMREPDSIRTTARLAHQREITVTVQPADSSWANYSPSAAARPERFTVRVMDTPALAALYPSVRAALQAAGLTAEQADAYRRALIVSAANRPAGYMEPPLVPVPAMSRLGRNLAFMRAPHHKEALKAFGATGMWVTP